MPIVWHDFTFSIMLFISNSESKYCLQRNHNYSKRYRRFHAKQDFLRNASAYADFVFQVCLSDDVVIIYHYVVVRL